MFFAVPSALTNNLFNRYPLLHLQSNSSNADDGFDPEKDDTFAPIHKTSIRPEQTLGVKDKQLLIAVERGDMATAKAILDMSEVMR